MIRELMTYDKFYGGNFVPGFGNLVQKVGFLWGDVTVLGKAEGGSL